MRTLLSKNKIEQMLNQKNHLEKKGMINVYICTNCRSQFMFVYLDTGVTPTTMKCSNCNEITAESCMHTCSQPASVWYRPKDLAEIKQIVEDAYKHDKELYERMSREKGASKKEIKKIMLKNYIKHYNGGGLFSKIRI